MIIENIPYKLGTKSFWLSMLGQGFPAIVLFFLLIVLCVISLIGPSVLFAGMHLRATQYVSMDNFLSLAILFFIALFLLTAAYAVLFSWLSYINYTFTLSDHALEINQGILARSEMSIPYRQIQDVDVGQSFFQRLIGVCRLVVLTAGHEDKDGLGEDAHSEGVFFLIDRQLALDLHEELVKRSNVQEVQQFAPLQTSQQFSDGPRQNHI